MKKFVLTTTTLFALAIMMTACTYNVSMAHTSGGSTEEMDEALTNTPNISPNVTVPVTPGSNLSIPSIPEAKK